MTMNITCGRSSKYDDDYDADDDDDDDDGSGDEDRAATFH